MLNLNECSGQWALVTGASSGIGREFCIQLASAGFNLVLVARREKELRQLAMELSDLYQIKALPLAKDLTQANAVLELESQLTQEGIKIRLLCNNAAFGHWGNFETCTAEIYEQMITLNTIAVTAMCHRFLPHLTSFSSSAIINVSSPAAYQPVPYMAVYAASKAFVHSFSQALYGELKDRGVLVQTLVPGPTVTEFDAKAGAYESAVIGRGTATEVVQISLAHLAQDMPIVTVAKGTFKQRLFAGLFPAKIVIREVGKMFRPPAN